ncbi:hypothetical protein [Labrys wisconsinensis]|uniref:Uncharacterized protein n=1 Tax=Labrys wisconsinensis TaxID=425677 RepID=A0ABU0JKM4_9HYPH|nr:hypothetical protein [Labrys wisconsinensis]MDQ0474829.1 hypothetical protein [Labrys wisconsinensis]
MAPRKKSAKPAAAPEETIHALIDQLQQHRALAPGADKLVAIAGDSKALFELASRSLAASATGLGECRRAQPFKPLRLVLKDEGLFWCCTHDPPHSVKVG